MRALVHTRVDAVHALVSAVHALGHAGRGRWHGAMPIVRAQHIPDAVPVPEHSPCLAVVLVWQNVAGVPIEQLILPLDEDVVLEQVGGVVLWHRPYSRCQLRSKRMDGDAASR